MIINHNLIHIEEGEEDFEEISESDQYEHPSSNEKSGQIMRDITKINKQSVQKTIPIKKKGEDREKEILERKIEQAKKNLISKVDEVLKLKEEFLILEVEMIKQDGSYKADITFQKEITEK